MAEETGTGGPTEQPQLREDMRALVAEAAHDLSNLIGVIVSHASFLAEDIEGGTASMEDVDAIQKAAQGATEVVKNLRTMGSDRRR